MDDNAPLNAAISLSAQICNLLLPFCLPLRALQSQGMVASWKAVAAHDRRGFAKCVRIEAGSR